LANGDIVIYYVGSFGYEYIHEVTWGNRLKGISAEAIRREKEICLALEKGKTVCFIGSTDKDYVFSEILKTYSINYSYFYEMQLLSKFKIRRSEFKTFLDDVGATYLFFDRPSVSEVICYVDNDIITGFSKDIGKGTLLYLPCIWGSDNTTYLIDHLKKLAKGLISYSAKKALEAPDFVGSFQFTNEKNVQNRILEITSKEIAPLQRKADHYVALKRILWFGDRNLVNATCDFLRNIGFQTSVDEIYEEDLWIVREKEKIVIIEVKGLNNNLTRQDISKLDEHREARQVPNLTGLLISNTFMMANSLEAKDQPFPPNVIEKAVNTNVLITRTLDLCRIYDFLEQNALPLNVLLDKMLGKKGWLTFRNCTIEIVM
jgi:hypothetical protein